MSFQHSACLPCVANCIAAEELALFLFVASTAYPDIAGSRVPAWGASAAFTASVCTSERVLAILSQAHLVLRK